MKYTVDNPDNNEWLNKYNEICTKDYGDLGVSLHHIKPRCKYPELANDPDNHAYLPLMEHCYAHYYLWKADRVYAMEFWFTCTYFRKNYGFQISDEEYEQLKEDVRYCRRLKRELKSKGE